MYFLFNLLVFHSESFEQSFFVKGEDVMIASVSSIT